MGHGLLANPWILIVIQFIYVYMLFLVYHPVTISHYIIQLLTTLSSTYYLILTDSMIFDYIWVSVTNRVPIAITHHLSQIVVITNHYTLDITTIYYHDI